MSANSAKAWPSPKAEGGENAIVSINLEGAREYHTLLLPEARSAGHRITINPDASPFTVAVPVDLESPVRWREHTPGVWVCELKGDAPS